MSSVADLELYRYIDSAVKTAERVLHEAKKLVDTDGQAAGLRCVEGWMILNGAAVTATRIGSQRFLKKISRIRSSIRVMGAELTRAGYDLILDVPETHMAFLVAAKEKARE